MHRQRRKREGLQRLKHRERKDRGNKASQHLKHKRRAAELNPYGDPPIKAAKP